MLCGSLDGRGVWGRMDTWIWMAESLYCLPETITLLVSVMLQYKIKIYFLIVLNSQSGVINKGEQATVTQITPWDFRGLRGGVSLPGLRLRTKDAGQSEGLTGILRKWSFPLHAPTHHGGLAALFLELQSVFQQFTAPAVEKNSSLVKNLSWEFQWLGIPMSWEFQSW